MKISLFSKQTNIIGWVTISSFNILGYFLYNSRSKFLYQGLLGYHLFWFYQSNNS